MIVTIKFLKRSASSAGICSGAGGIVPELYKRLYASSNALFETHSIKLMRYEMRRHGLKNLLVQSYTGLDQFLCPNGMRFNNLVVHTEEGIGEDCGGSQIGRSMFLS